MIIETPTPLLHQKPFERYNFLRKKMRKKNDFRIKTLSERFSLHTIIDVKPTYRNIYPDNILTQTTTH